MTVRGLTVVVSCALVLAPASLSAKEKDKGADRLAWLGLHRGPLAPARAEALEALLLDELDGYESFRLVDAGGGALDDRLLAAEAARAQRLIDEGVDLLLNFKQKKAITKFDQAIEVFESRLTALRDQELLHEALLAKAEALFQNNNKTAATETLKNLAALSPKRVPNKKTHPQKFVALWDRALEELGAAGRVIVEAADPACTIIFDGKVLGNAPVEIPDVLPGKHYVVARWPFFSRAESVQVAPGRELRTSLDRAGPAETARVSLLETIEKRQGANEATMHARRIADIAGANESLAAAIREEGGRQTLLVAKHGAQGEIETMVLVPIQEGIDSEAMSAAVRQLGAVLFVDKSTGELEIVAGGEARPAEGLTALMYGRPGSAAVVATRDPPERNVEPSERDPLPAVVDEPEEERALTPPLRAEIEEDRPITKEWWFWVGVGAAFVGVAVVGGSFILRPDATSTELELVVNLEGN
jgi:tetratricopeptide (TPR) repeat protein